MDGFIELPFTKINVIPIVGIRATTTHTSSTLSSFHKNGTRQINFPFRRIQARYASTTGIDKDLAMSVSVCAHENIIGRPFVRESPKIHTVPSSKLAGSW